MAGHSKWKQIKHKKAAADAKRGKIFSKLSMAISAAARTDPNPDTNPALRVAIEKAKEHNMPADNVERAIKRVTEAKEQIDEVAIEAYGPEGVALYIAGITDNTNRTIAEIKALFKDHDAKIGEPGSVAWAFDRNNDGAMIPKFTQEISEESRQKLARLCEALEDRDDVQAIYTNAADPAESGVSGETSGAQ